MNLDRLDIFDKNDNFVQLYKQNISTIRWLNKNNPTALDVFLFIIEHMDDRNALACSYAVLEEALGKSKPTITRAIKCLKENGFVGVLKMGTSNVYVVNHEVAWTSKGNLKKYCKFNGNILITHKENLDYSYEGGAYEKIKKLKEKDK